MIDFLVAGGGVVGLSVARALLKRKAGSVAVLEKESSLGVHASGQNSGVVHAGIYYKPGSLKAKFCVEGSRALLEYADERGVRFERPGKVIVAADEREADEVERLFHQAQQNGVRVELLDETDLRRIEPGASTVRRALFSPDTALIDPKGVLSALKKEIASMGGDVFLRTKAVRFDPPAKRVFTRGASWGYGFFVNTAGLEAHRIAHAFGAGKEYRMLPVKGMYRSLSDEAASRFHRLVYPVPDPGMPFLGIHLTPTLDGRMLAGPTATPMPGREWAVNFFDLGRMLAFDTNRVRSLAFREMRHLTKNGFYDALKKIAPSLKPSDLGPFVKSGVRAQLVEAKSGLFEMDFVIKRAPDSLHILNAVSPAFTCALSFAEHVADQILGSPKEALK